MAVRGRSGDGRGGAVSGGYTPVFSSIFTGTLFGKYPDLPLWLVLLAMADRHGVIDAHPSYISAASGIHQDDVEDCIRRFCEPDPASRTPDDDGRRLIPLEGRGFGWRIVNHGKYREKARKQAWDAERTASGRDAERKRLSRRVPTCPDSPDASRLSPLSDTDTDTDSEREGSAEGRSPTAAPPPAVTSGADAPAAEAGKGEGKPKKATKPPASRRCPEGFEPDRDYALRTVLDMDVEEEIQKFRDWEFAKPRTDWQATWRTWVRNCRDTGRYSRRGKVIGGIQWQ